MTGRPAPFPSPRAARAVPMRDGFALLLALVLVMLAGVALAGVARRSATEALHARTEAETLQHRWAVRTLRALMVPRLAPTLAEAGRAARNPDPGDPRDLRQRGASTDDPAATPARSLWFTLELAGIPYDLRLTDEQAKVDVNRLLEAADAATVRSVGGDLLPAGRHAADDAATVDLHPLVRGDFAERAVEQLDPIAGWGQLFDATDPSALPAMLAGSPDRPGLADHLTLLGGPINLRTAPDAVVREAGSAVMGVYPTEQLLQARAERERFDLRSWLSEQSKWNDRQRSAAERWFTDASNAHGLWIIARGRQRDRYHLTLARTAEAPESPGDPSARRNDGETTGGPDGGPGEPTGQTASEVVAEARDATRRPWLLIHRMDFDW